MIKTITIGKIYKNDADKQGRRYEEKYGRDAGAPKWKVDIYAQGLPDGAKSCSGFASKGSPVLEWKEGDTVAVELTKKGQYLNFSPVSEHVVMLLDLRDRVEKLEGIVILGKPAPKKPVNLTMERVEKFKEKLNRPMVEGEPSEEELKSLFGGEI